MALEPFQCSPLECEDQVDPGPLEYLRDPSYATSSYDIHLSVSIQGQHMEKPATVCRSNYRYLYWNSRQQLVHHAVTGCIIHPGDLMGSGTISGTDAASLGCMLELSWMGSREVKLGDNEVRKFFKRMEILLSWKDIARKKTMEELGLVNVRGKFYQPPFLHATIRMSSQSLMQSNKRSSNIASFI